MCRPGARLIDRRLQREFCTHVFWRRREPELGRTCLGGLYGPGAKPGWLSRRSVRSQTLRISEREPSKWTSNTRCSGARVNTMNARPEEKDDA